MSSILQPRGGDGFETFRPRRIELSTSGCGHERYEYDGRGRLTHVDVFSPQRGRYDLRLLWRGRQAYLTQRDGVTVDPPLKVRVEPRLYGRDVLASESRPPRPRNMKRKKSGNAAQ